MLLFIKVDVYVLIIILVNNYISLLITSEKTKMSRSMLSDEYEFVMRPTGMMPFGGED